MKFREDSLLGRYSGLRVAWWSFVLGVAGALPLLLYVVLGPADGNPIGLGLLAFLAVQIGCLGVALGLVIAVVQLLGRRAG